MLKNLYSLFMEYGQKKIFSSHQIRFLSIMIIFLLSFSSLYAKVPQKIAVLDFSSQNKDNGYFFLKKSIPQSLELKLDKMERFYVIRQYLWEENYVPDKPVLTAEDILRFCLKTGMDGVITGKIVYGKNGADVIVSAYDAAKSSFVFTDKKSIPLNDKIFNTVDEWLEPVAIHITNLFPPKDESVIIKERKKIKYIYEDIKKRTHQFIFSAGYTYALANTSVAMASNLNSHSSNIRTSHSLNGIDLYAGYRYKSAEAGIQAIFADGAQQNKMSEFTFRAGAWLLRDVFNPFLQISFYNYSYPDGFFKSSVLQFGLKMKPVENFIFGMIVGPCITDEREYKYFTINSGLNRQSDHAMFLSFLYEIHLSSRLALYLNMGMKETKVRYKTPDLQRDFSFENSVSYISAQAAYKLEWGK